jgi:2-amino-4-hydroxy-6-hydroxymethyldihydropteridine diphosphokinase
MNSVANKASNMAGRIPLEPQALNDAVIVALGCNDKGPEPSREAILEAALKRLEREDVAIVSRSGWWESAAWPRADDPPFLNGVAIVRTSLAPVSLLERLHAVEAAFGRIRAERNAPRTLDLDLIAYGRLVGRFGGGEKPLILPHPRASERLFVMGPLAEVAPEWTCPLTGRMARDMVETTTVGLDARPKSGIPLAPEAPLL